MVGHIYEHMLMQWKYKWSNPLELNETNHETSHRRSDSVMNTTSGLENL